MNGVIIGIIMLSTNDFTIVVAATAIMKAIAMLITCSYSKITYCEYGCFEGKCQNKTCNPVWKCVNSKTLGKLSSDCKWEKFTYCGKGCINNECLDLVPIEPTPEIPFGNENAES